MISGDSCATATVRRRCLTIWPRQLRARSPKIALRIRGRTRYIGSLSKSNRGPQERTPGSKAYASMAKVEGLRLSKESAARLERTKGLTPEKRRAEVLRAYGADAPTRK
jgi:hypothetical protein